MTYNANNEGTRNTIGIIASWIGPSEINLDTELFCEDYVDIRERVTRNMLDTDRKNMCACGRTVSHSEERYECPVCRTQTKFLGVNSLPEHIMMSESLSDFVENYRQKYFLK